MITRLFAYRSSLRFLLPIAAFLFSAVAGISVAAWLDAPNAPPNYGLTPPYTQADFKPMNLGTSPQTKNGSMAIVGTLIATSTTPTSFPNFPGNIVASGFYDSEGTGYFLDPATMSGYSGVFSSSVGIRQRYPGASLSVNNYYDPLDLSHAKETSGKVGVLGDAIYAYTNSTGAAISAEQANPAGYGIYSSGGINYFGGDVQVGTAASPKNLCLNGDCKAAWPSISGGLLNYIPKWASSTSLTNSGIFENASGNVGIGTMTPNQKFEVSGNTKATGYVSGVNIISGGYRLDLTPVITYGPWQPNWLCCGGGPGFADSCDTQSLAVYSCSGAPKTCKDTANQEQVYGTTGCQFCGKVGGYYRDIDCGTTATVNSATWTGQ